MSRTTGPVLAIGAITVTNRVIFNSQDMQWRVPIATGIAALAFNLAEQAFPRAAVALAYTALVTVLLTRVDPGVPSPVESMNRWWNS
jgi:hypothetical protein